jgi:hypothetical protein
MQRSLLGLILASFFSLAISAALSADLSRSSYGNASVREDETSCSCDAPGIVGRFCAIAYTCKDMGGLCLGRCAAVSENDAACSCDAPGIVGRFCAVPYTCKDMQGLCLGRC